MSKTRRINFSIKSRKGGRKINQDALLCGYNQTQEFCAIVCDGIGSINGSEYASRLVAKTFIDEFIKTKKILNPVNWFNKTLDICFDLLSKLIKDKKIPGISTTLALVIVTANDFYSFNIGDTRIYKMDNNEIKQISFDHNYKNYLISQNTPKEGIDAQKQNWKSLTNFIDVQYRSASKYASNLGSLNNQCMFLICTDGLYETLLQQEIWNIAWNKKILPLNLRADILINKALKQDGTDNASCILIHVK